MTGLPTGRWRNLLGAFSTVLGGAVAWATAGTLAAVLMPLVEPWPQTPLAVRWVVQLALGFGLGWWLGLFWTAVVARRLHLAQWRRGWRVGLPWAAALTAVVVGAAVRTTGLTWRASVLVALVLVSLLPFLAARCGGAVRCP